MKYRHCDSKLILKVTDDRTVGSAVFLVKICAAVDVLAASHVMQCLKYKASHAQSLKKIEKLNSIFLRSATEKTKA